MTDRKRAVLSMRLTAAEQERLRALATAAGTSMSEYLRQQITADSDVLDLFKPLPPVCGEAKPGTWSAGSAPYCQLPAFHNALPWQSSELLHMWQNTVTGQVLVWNAQTVGRFVA